MKIMDTSYKGLGMCMTSLVTVLAMGSVLAVDIKLHYFFMQFTWCILGRIKMWNSNNIWYLLCLLCLRIWDMAFGYIVNIHTNCVWNIVFMAAVTKYFIGWWRNEVMNV